MLDDSGYKSGGTIGGKLGLAVSAVIGLPTTILIFFFSGNAITACGQFPTCSPRIELATSLLFLLFGLLVVGFGVRFVANGLIALFRRLRVARR